MTKKRAGLKTENKEKSKESSLLDSCYKCSLWAYIEAICGNNNALIVSGEHSNEELEEVKTMLTAEFAELSGNIRTEVSNNLIRKIYLYKTQLDGFRLCLHLLTIGEIEEVKAFLKSQGIRGGDTPESIAKKIESSYKSKSILLKQEITRLNGLHKESGDIPTRQYYEGQIADVSKFMGFRIDKKSVTLSEYAAYLNSYTKSLSNGSNKQQ